MSRNELIPKNIVADVINQNPITPQQMRVLLDDDPAGRSLKKIEKYGPPALLGVHFLTLATLNQWGDSLPSFGTLPPLVHNSLQAVHNFSVNAADSPALREHIPYISLDLAGTWGLISGLRGLLLGRTGKKIEASQIEVLQRIAEGIFRYEMVPDHSAVFVGNGDRIGELLQELLPLDQVMLYSHEKITSDVWQHIQQTGRQEEIFESLDRGDFKHAREAVLLPVKDEDMFLPDEIGHDMTLDEIRLMIDIFDAYSQERGIPQKEVVIVGSPAMSQTYIESNRLIDSSGIDAIRTTVRLDEMVAQLNEGRDENRQIKIIDPTELVMQKVMALANGRDISFISTEDSFRRYGERFFDALSQLDYKPTGEEAVNVIYNITDIPTQTTASTRDIVIIIDPKMKEHLLQRGVPAEQIILVPELVTTELGIEMMNEV